LIFLKSREKKIVMRISIFGAKKIGMKLHKTSEEALCTGKLNPS
jgi:hypothetical protein